ncbi:hypothetical protein EJ06DRAFT_534460 [Trichodelitschia bisporula]|uniref:Uncharacterized protein n=1 Tax=Trichodelitschia bisporula TaxID=703511 RepID=A0A6G1HJI8_9PEZI|nr:hypothetical protein EJ06DRAFT_534460 [Trichodelitschia bisporula]
MAPSNQYPANGRTTRIIKTAVPDECHSAVEIPLPPSNYDGSSYQSSSYEASVYARSSYDPSIYAETIRSSSSDGTLRSSSFTEALQPSSSAATIGSYLSEDQLSVLAAAMNRERAGGRGRWDQWVLMAGRWLSVVTRPSVYDLQINDGKVENGVSPLLNREERRELALYVKNGKKKE